MDFNIQLPVLTRRSFSNLFINRAKIQPALQSLLTLPYAKSPHFPRGLGHHKSMSPHFPHHRSSYLLQSSHKVPNSPTYSPGSPLGEADDKCINQRPSFRPQSPQCLDSGRLKLYFYSLSLTSTLRPVRHGWSNQETMLPPG